MELNGILFNIIQFILVAYVLEVYGNGDFYTRKPKFQNVNVRK
jgi:hypothetical protein